MKKEILTGLLPDEISSLLSGKKEKYRGEQIFRWIHDRCATTFDEMTNISKSLREEISDKFLLGAITQIEIKTSSDGSTNKFLWELMDGNRIESVIIRDEGRTTICISSQVGCKMGCSFCRTGEMGFIKNLSAGEIVDQLIKIRSFLRSSDEDITNIVFMGMGEPLDNYESVKKTIQILNMETAFEIGLRKITVSTCGVVPGIIKLSQDFRKAGLAISLNAVDDELRDQLMPINKKYPLKELFAASKEFTRVTKRRVTFEYILMDGINDSTADAVKLIDIAKDVPSKINLITFNEYDGAPYKTPSRNRVMRFQKILIDANVTALIRKSKGTDILAACGQLAAKSKK